MEIEKRVEEYKGYKLSGDVEARFQVCPGLWQVVELEFEDVQLDGLADVFHSACDEVGIEFGKHKLITMKVELGSVG